MMTMNTQSFDKSQSTLQLDDMMSRLHDCQELVESELARYQSATVESDGDAQVALVTSIVIPVYNEERTILRVLTRLAALPFAKELIVVDDCSQDGTREILGRLEGMPGLRLILKETNAGKGAALRTGFEHVTGDIVVVQDADLEYDPADIPHVIAPLMKDEADVVFGSRFIGDEVHDNSAVHRFGNWLLTAASNLFTGVRLTDMETCYKAFRRCVLKDLTISQNRFGVEPEMTAKLVRLGYRIVEVPISYRARGYKEGKKIGIRDLFKAFYCIVRYGVAD